MQYDKHKKAEKILKTIDKNPEMYLVIHYSCESFYDITDGRTPRITSIAVYNFESAQTDSFSLHKIAERKHINLSEIEDKYDQLEKQMLTEFFKYAKEHKDFAMFIYRCKKEGISSILNLKMDLINSLCKETDESKRMP